jgi:hypothetical protein
MFSYSTSNLWPFKLATMLREGNVLQYGMNDTEASVPAFVEESRASL